MERRSPVVPPTFFHTCWNSLVVETDIEMGTSVGGFGPVSFGNVSKRIRGSSCSYLLGTTKATSSGRTATVEIKASSTPQTDLLPSQAQPICNIRHA
mmetsp:Transcript_22070/g.32868  ORF Transcript_22070/g.32868 Transcript_22070/m.32868 type:complete len:97 (+) Transcript_22070:398-688(+)